MKARSTRADATVTKVSPDGYTVTLEVLGRRVRVEPLATYAVGDSVPVLVDPEDPGHVTLVAEPDDPSWRIGVAAVLLVVLLGVAARLWSRGRRRYDLLHHGGPGPGAFCLGACSAFLIGSSATVILALRRVWFRGALLPASFLFVMLWPAVLLQSTGGPPWTFAWWSAGLWTGSHAGVALGRWPARHLRARTG